MANPRYYLEVRYNDGSSLGFDKEKLLIGGLGFEMCPYGQCHEGTTGDWTLGFERDIPLTDKELSDLERNLKRLNPSEFSSLKQVDRFASSAVKQEQEVPKIAGLPITDPRVTRAMADAFERTQRRDWDYP